MTNLTETTITSKIICTGKFLQIIHDEVQLANGQIAMREYIKHPGAVAIIAITPDGQIILERQWRHPVARLMLEIPAGKIDLHEDCMRAAKRELAEETGYSSIKWYTLGTCHACIGYSDEEITYYLAVDVVPGISHLDDGELLEVFTMPVEEVMRMAYNGEITDSKTLAGLMLYQGYLLNK